MRSNSSQIRAPGQTITIDCISCNLFHLDSNMDTSEPHQNLNGWLAPSKNSGPCMEIHLHHASGRGSSSLAVGQPVIGPGKNTPSSPSGGNPRSLKFPAWSQTGIVE